MDPNEVSRGTEIRNETHETKRWPDQNGCSPCGTLITEMIDKYATRIKRRERRVRLCMWKWMDAPSMRHTDVLELMVDNVFKNAAGPHLKYGAGLTYLWQV